MKLLIIAPLHDPATFFSNEAVRRLVEWIDKENVKRYREGINLIKYKVLSGIKASRLTIYLNRDVDGVFFYGHGLDDRLGDLWIRVLPLIDKRNIHWFKDKIIYTMSCLSGKELGKVAIEKTVKVYFGQTERFYGFIPSLRHPFFKDWYQLVNVIPKSLISGDQAFIALQKYEKLAKVLHTKYLYLRAKENVYFLFKNALYMELYGDGTAKLPP